MITMYYVIYSAQELTIDDLPAVFIKPVKTKTLINCTTADLVSNLL